jgi:hypothetical protein
VKDDAVGVSSQRKGKSIVVENPLKLLISLLLKKRAIPLLRGSKDNLKRQGMKLMK